VADLLEWRTVGDARIRADGKWVVYAEGAKLWVSSTDGKEKRQWTEEAGRDRSPRWSPDGERIGWIAERDGRARIVVRKLDAAAETEVPSTAAPLTFAWSAEGDAIAFTAVVEANATPPAWAPKEVLPLLRRPTGTVQVFVAPVGGGPARQVSHAETGCAGEPSWTLDGKAVVAACDDAIVALAIGGGPAKVLSKDAGQYESPVVSPDGGRVAYLFTERKAQSYTVRKLWVMNVDGSRARALSGSLDRDATDPQWSAESRTVYFLADDHGATHVYAAHNDGTVRQVTTKPERLQGLSLADNGRAVSVRQSATEGGDVVTFTVDAVSQPVTLAAPNEHLLADRQIAAVEELTYQSDGRNIQAWLVKPPGFEAGKKYPLLVEAADDPRSMYGGEFSLRAQILAARGFLVLHANPRGTPGYGEQFGNLLRTRYPGDDFDDLMRGVDAAIATGSVDTQRVSIAGGVLAAWAIGHTPRFYRAVARRPVVDWAVEVDRAAAAMGGMPWDDPEQYVKHSPIYFAQNFRTPTLVLAGEGDAQSEMLYRALRERRVDTALARVAGDPALELQTIIGWLEK
jgi:dipeptidyl aminopeptidase/acylaminoacyl peptidase